MAADLQRERSLRKAQPNRHTGLRNLSSNLGTREDTLLHRAIPNTFPDSLDDHPSVACATGL